MSAPRDERILETYAAALQHDLADLPPDARRVGVVRRPTGWFRALVCFEGENKRCHRRILVEELRERVADVR